MVFDILALISVLIMITLLRRLVNIFPSLMACMIRWKESVNLESSVKLSYDRSIIAVGMIIPFCLVAERFRLYNPSFMDGLNENLRTGLTFGIFAAYLLIRLLASMMVRTRKGRKKIFDTASKAAYTFFIILSLLLVILGGILSFTGVPDEVTKSAMLWVSAFIYALFLLRKTQIFASSFSIVTSFLYLCALEIIPTGILIAPVLVF